VEEMSQSDEEEEDTLRMGVGAAFTHLRDGGMARTGIVMGRQVGSRHLFSLLATSFSGAGSWLLMPLHLTPRGAPLPPGSPPPSAARGAVMSRNHTQN